MFYAKLTDGSILKKIVESIKDLVSEINLDVSSTGISLQAMDSSHVALVTLTLSSEGFEEFVCKKNIILGVSLSNLHKILKCATNEDSIFLTTEENLNSLHINFENPKIKKKTEFRLSLIMFDVEHLGIPQTHYGSKIVMNSNEFSRICRELYTLNETVVIETTKGLVKFSVLSDTIGGCIRIEDNPEDSDNQVCIMVYESANLAFSLKYLNMFTKAAIISDQVTLNLSVEFPLMIEYKIPKLGVLNFHLAPRISDEK